MKIVIFGGAGGTGSSTAFNLLAAAGSHDIVLVDTRENLVLSHTMDLENAAALSPGRHVVRGGSPGEALDADVVVISASVSQRVNTSRLVFLEDNARIVLGCLEPLYRGGFTGPVLLLTNPVDALLTWVHRLEWFDPACLLGYTLNDTLRLRTAVGRVLGRHPRDVEAWTIGEHGERQVPLWDRVAVDGRVAQLAPEQVAEAQEYVATWYTKHVALDCGRTSTWMTGSGAASVIAAMADESETPLPVSTLLDGQYGISGVFLTLPALLGPRGVREVLAWALTPEQLVQLREAATSIAASAGALADLLSSGRPSTHPT